MTEEIEETNEQPNLPALVENSHRVTDLAIPVSSFEGEYVRIMYGVIPKIRLPMDYGYARDTHLKVELEVRVRSVLVDEMQTGKQKGELFREHNMVTEHIKIVGVYSAEEADIGVGGGLAANGHDIEDEDEPETETDTRPEQKEQSDGTEPGDQAADDPEDPAHIPYDPGF